MRKIALALGLFILPLMASGAWAVTIVDNYYGSNDHGYGDIIGSAAEFDIQSMDVTLSGTTLIVDIATNYDGSNAGFQALTDYLDFGDLFISVDGWNPDTSAANYLNDNWISGEQWEYAFDVDTGNLYALPSGGTAYGDAVVLSEEVIPSGWIYRNGQEVLVDATGLSAEKTGGSAAYNAADKVLTMSFDIGGLGWDLSNLGFHWGMTCGNDTIEGLASIPEPATGLLLSTGLLGLGLVRRRDDA